jgi:predicted O-linked N-acetylglucosamine transferase (SPINDLY family)
MTDSLHTEQLVRLPECAWCYRPDDDSPPIERAAASEAVTFGSFGVASKINGPLIAMWAEILRAMPDSRMLIKTGHGLAGWRIRRFARSLRSTGSR